MLNERGKPTEAEPLLREALTTNIKLLGPTHHQTSATRRDLGYSLALQGRYAEAESLLLQAYHDLGKRSDYWSWKEMRETLRRLVEVYRKEGRVTDAAKYRRVLERRGWSQEGGAQKSSP